MALVLAAMLISWREGVGLEKEMLVAVVRSFVQLIGIGFALQYVFAQKGTALILVSISVMVLIAGYTAGERAKAVPGSHVVATLAVLIATSLTTTALVRLRVFPFEPRYVIPIAGNITGNAMSVAGVTMKRLRDDLRLQRLEVEVALALGANPRQASLVQLCRALGSGMSPIIDTAKTIGLVSLPGAMTGLIMGGASPLEAVQLQMVVLYMLTGAATFSGLAAAYLSQRRFFTSAYQLDPSLLWDGPAATSPDVELETTGVPKNKFDEANPFGPLPMDINAWMEMPLLQIRNLSLTSSNQERILDDVSLEVPRRKIVGLIGPSGSGKSTLLRAMNRLWEPGKGTVLLNGEDITTLDVVKLRRKVGALFQSPALFDGTVADNVRYGPRLQGRRLEDDDLFALLRVAGLKPKMASTPASQLSGGQAQRVALARTLANYPDCLLLDEPTSALDPGATRKVEKTIMELRDKLWMTVVLVSHDVEQIRRVADEVCLLVNGRVVERGTPEELFGSGDTLSKQFLEGTLGAGHAA